MHRLRMLRICALTLFCHLFPWVIKRPLMQLLLGFRLAHGSRIGFALIFAEKVVLEKNASIGHFTIVSPIGLLHLMEQASIGRGNRIAGMQSTRLYADEKNRKSALIMEPHAAITRRHLIDCSNTVTIGAFATVAGWNSQILSHSPNFSISAQTTKPVRIGRYTFMGTGSIVLFGAMLPDYSVLGAGSVLTKAHEETHRIYAGNPAMPVAKLDPAAAYFHRPHSRFHPEA